MLEEEDILLCNPTIFVVVGEVLVQNVRNILFLVGDLDVVLGQVEKASSVVVGSARLVLGAA